MRASQKPKTARGEQQRNDDGIIAMFVLALALLWRYSKRLFSVETIANLEKKQGAGSGERDVEDVLLDQALENNPHHLHLNESQALTLEHQFGHKSSSSSEYEIIVSGGRDEPDR
mgnify:CR=1 FL=1|tara:strand:+ start:376 stop:720 length:345 start_codon:yes stop_codon:yes gene_type:complete